MSCFLFTLPLEITSELLVQWLSFKDVNRLDSSCSSLITRKQYLRCVSGLSLVLNGLRVDSSKFLDYVNWLNMRAISVAGLSIPTLFLKENRDDLLSTKNVARLKSLNAENCADLSDRIFQKIIKDCAFLRKVCLGSDHYRGIITDQSLLHLSRTTRVLRKFKLKQNAIVTDLGASSIWESNRGILHVELRNCSGLGENCLLALAKHCPSLQVLKLAYIKHIKDSILAQVLHSCRSLRELVLVGCTAGLPELRLPARESLESLTALTIGDVSDATDLRLGQFLAHTPNLETLTLRDVKCLSDGEFAALVNVFSKLTALKLESCPRLTATGMQALLCRCPALRELHVFHGNITQTVVESLARSCPHLTSLSLSWCPGVTDATLSALLAQDALPPLAQLSLNGCSQVTNVAVKALAHFLPALTRLSVCYCPRVTAEAVAEISARHAALTLVRV